MLYLYYPINPYNNYKVGIIIIPILWIRKLSLGRSKEIVQGHTTSKWHSWHLNDKTFYHRVIIPTLKKLHSYLFYVLLGPIYKISSTVNTDVKTHI